MKHTVTTGKICGNRCRKTKRNDYSQPVVMARTGVNSGSDTCCWRLQDLEKHGRPLAKPLDDDNEVSE